MFTGLVAGTGEVVYIRRLGAECRFGFRPPFNPSGIADGESIAVNGACLSVESHDAATFSAYASAETMAKTNLGHLFKGSKVNMERALAFGERVGGHLVSGHVDCQAVVREIARVGLSTRFTFNFPEEYAAQVIPKGSVALDGISLTINACGRDYLEVNVMPDTMARTAIRQWQPGYSANMETDMIGKYVLGLMRPWALKKTEAQATGATTAITKNFLGENGFLLPRGRG